MVRVASSFVLLLILLEGCSSSSAIDASDAGKSVIYEAAAASFDIEVVPISSETETGLMLYLSIPNTSLIFEKVPQGFRARYDITVRLHDRRSDGFVQELSWQDTTLVEHYDQTQIFAPIMRTKRITSPPGQYRLEVELDDRIDGKSARRTLGVSVENVRSSSVAIGRPILWKKSPDGATAPVMSFHVPLSGDSLQCRFDLYNLPRDRDIPIELMLLQYRSDTTSPISPYTAMLLPLPLGWGLVNIERPDTITREIRAVRATSRKETLVMALPPLAVGLYQFSLRLEGQAASGEDTTIIARRFYAMKGPGFPKPVRLSELIDPLVYIATPKEMAQIRRASTPAEQRAKFEEFWLSTTHDPSLAAAQIKRYYTRVEEANRLFTTTRDGWRTDRGMLYCIIGAPADVTTHLDTQTWTYEYQGSNEVNTYVFKRLLKETEGLTIIEYVLNRLPSYEMFWDRMVDKWRSGQMP
ncbi:MAG TPA: GWxTD domain-containing protein [Bacteroidota bacterium]|nr:GWxTD domain-containing protein [Bacteroidota bacterium]